MAVGAARDGRQAAAGASTARGCAARRCSSSCATRRGCRCRWRPSWCVGAGTPGFVGGLDAVLGYSFRERLPEIEVPALIVWGRNDILIPVEDAYEFERLIGANARAEVFDDTGHLAMLERPVALQRAARRVHRRNRSRRAVELRGLRDRALAWRLHDLRGVLGQHAGGDRGLGGS